MLRALVYVVPVALAIYALIDLSRSTSAERGRLHPAAWVAVVVLLPVLGPIAWILISRSNRPNPPPGRPEGRRRPGPPAPDDDPEFLWRIEQEQRRRERSRPRPEGPGPEQQDVPEPPDEDPPSR